MTSESLSSLNPSAWNQLMRGEEDVGHICTVGRLISQPELENTGNFLCFLVTSLHIGVFKRKSCYAGSLIIVINLLAHKNWT